MLSNFPDKNLVFTKTVFLYYIVVFLTFMFCLNMKYRLKYNNKVANINIAVLFYKKLNIFVYYIHLYKYMYNIK